MNTATCSNHRVIKEYDNSCSSVHPPANCVVTQRIPARNGACSRGANSCVGGVVAVRVTEVPTAGGQMSVHPPLQAVSGVTVATIITFYRVRN